MEKEIIFLIQLLHARGLGGKPIRELINHYGSAEATLAAGLDRTQQTLFDRWEIAPHWHSDLEEIKKNNIHLISYRDPAYPKQLLKIPDFPLLLYVKGTLPQTSACLALIGTRNATLYGQQMAQKLAREVAQAGVWVISGLARGIDTQAHLGALEGGGNTVAVIGSGLSQVYPQENRSLAETIACSGAVISEYPMRTPPAKGLFPRRNRIISGLSQVVCLVESPSRGGGMLTMEIAKQHKRHLFAVPGRLDWPSFEGNHQLLAENQAQLATKGADLLKMFGLEVPLSVPIAENPMHTLSADERELLTLLPKEEKSIDALVLLTQLPVMQLNALLTRLVLKKFVKEFPGKIYKKHTW
jgi:DNA processing protein